MYHYLKSHPQLFLPRRKELLHFCTDLHFRFPLLNEEQFLRYYRSAPAGTLCGEVSVWNLMSVEAPRNIFHFAPHARIIMMLRRPADLLYALHANHVVNGNETIADFAEAWQAVPLRKQGHAISPVLRSPVEALFYTEICRFGTQLQRYLEWFPLEQIHIIFFDDLQHDVANTYKSLLRFLGVDEHRLPRFRIYNARKRVRSQWLLRTMVDAPSWLRQLGKWIFPHQSRRRDWLMDQLWHINTKVAAPGTISAGLRRAIAQHYRAEMDLLERLSGLSLDRWREDLRVS